MGGAINEDIKKMLEIQTSLTRHFIINLSITRQRLKLLGGNKNSVLHN